LTTAVCRRRSRGAAGVRSTPSLAAPGAIRSVASSAAALRQVGADGRASGVNTSPDLDDRPARSVLDYGLASGRCEELIKIRTSTAPVGLDSACELAADCTDDVHAFKMRGVRPSKQDDNDKPGRIPLEAAQAAWTEIRVTLGLPPSALLEHEYVPTGAGEDTGAAVPWRHHVFVHASSELGNLPDIAEALRLMLDHMALATTAKPMDLEHEVSRAAWLLRLELEAHRAAWPNPA
jgi:hypothetical protein